MKSALENSFFLKRGIFPIMLFCVLILLGDIRSVYDGISENLINAPAWWVIFLAIGIFFWAGWRTKQRYEKIGCYVFSFRFFLEGVSQFFEKEIVIGVVVVYLVLDIYATSNLLVGYKKFSQDLEESRQQQLKANLKGWKIPLIVFVGFTAAIFFVWLSRVIRQ